MILYIKILIPPSYFHSTNKAKQILHVTVAMFSSVRSPLATHFAGIFKEWTIYTKISYYLLLKKTATDSSVYSFFLKKAIHFKAFKLSCYKSYLYLNL